MKKQLKFSLHKNKAGDFYIRCTFGNGQIFWATEGYKRESKALKSLETMVALIHDRNYMIAITG